MNNRLTMIFGSSLFFSLQLLGSFLQVVDVCGSEFRVGGKVNTMTYDAVSGKLLDSRTVSFKLWSRDLLWFVRLTPATNEFYDYIDASFDGTNVFYLNNFETAIKRRRLAGDDKIGENIATGVISKGYVLRSLFAEEVAPLWLAFGSGSYFRSVKSGDAIETVYVSPRMAMNDPSPHLQKASFSLQGELPNLPERVDYLMSNHTNGSYAVMEFLNSSIGLFPQRSEMVFYKDLNGKKVGVDKKYAITVESVSTNEIGMGFVPSMPGIVLVTDLRLSQKRGLTVSYPVHTDSWPGLEQLKTLTVYTNYAVTRKNVDSSGASPNMRMLIIGIVFVCCNAFFILWYKLNNKPKIQA